jgi:hypothetical protein
LSKPTGDGLLIEFGSVVDALRCAVEVQRAMAGRNAGVPPDGRIKFRIGINMGDIVVDDGDIFGDGVNVAIGELLWIWVSAAAETLGRRRDRGSKDHADCSAPWNKWGDP